MWLAIRRDAGRPDRPGGDPAGPQTGRIELGIFPFLGRDDRPRGRTPEQGAFVDLFPERRREGGRASRTRSRLLATSRRPMRTRSKLGNAAARHPDRADLDQPRGYSTPRRMRGTCDMGRTRGDSRLVTAFAAAPRSRARGRSSASDTIRGPNRAALRDGFGDGGLPTGVHARICGEQVNRGYPVDVCHQDGRVA